MTGVEPRPALIDTDHPDLIIDAADIGVRASWGHIYGPVSIRVPEGGVTILAGPAGRGRTALLLTLAGRMKPTTGRLTAFGRADDPTRLFRRAEIAYLDEIDEIAQTLRIHDVLTEQLRWRSPWWKWVGQADADDLAQICSPVFGDHPLPALESFVEELPELTAALFRIAIANVERPPLLVVGGIDRLTRLSNTAALLDRLTALGSEQTIITADVNAARHERGVHQVIDIDHLIDDSQDGV